MAVPRFLPTWLGGKVDRVSGGGILLPNPNSAANKTADALPMRPEPVADPLPENLERLLRNPEIAVPQDRAVHEIMRDYARRYPDAKITRELYLNLWALFDREMRERA